MDTIGTHITVLISELSLILEWNCQNWDYTKAIVHGFSKNGVLGMKRNRTVSCQIVHLYVLNLHTKNYSHSVWVNIFKGVRIERFHCT